ncbi:lipopolysaccharide biosynthesis protein [Anaeromyxobacter sp. Red801]|uniref:lipopolysaccharide biosynthesis protein n=1 Tax=Anaeromyxobacter sp. Red801 TaxID=3411632 RepID=UPI003BA3A23D
MVRLRPFEQDTPHGRSQERYRRIALTTLSGFAVRGLGTAVGLVTVPLLLAYLGKERFGLWSTVTTVVAWATLFDLGIANGLVNCLAKAHGRGERDLAAKYVSTALAALVAIAAVLAAGVAASAWSIPWERVLAVRGAVDAQTVRWSVVAALATFIIGLPLSVGGQIYAAYQRAYVANAFAMIGAVVGVVALLAALGLGAGLPALVLVFGLGGLVASALGLGYAMRVAMPWLRFRVGAVDREALREVMARSIPMFLFQVGALVVNETQAIILAHRCNLAIVAEYAILMRLYLIALGVVQLSTSSFVPSFREAVERGEHAWVRASFAQFVRVRVGLALLGGAALVLVGNPLLRIWLRRSDVSFSPSTWIVLWVMMVSVTWVGAHSDLLAITDRLWGLVALVFVNATATVLLTWWLAPHLQVLGVVIASGAVTALAFTWILPWMARPVLRGGNDVGK